MRPRKPPSKGDLPPVFKRINAKHHAPVGAAGMTALVSASITLIYGVLFSPDQRRHRRTLFWSLFAFGSIVFLLPYVAMSLAFLRLRKIDADAERPYRVPGGAASAIVSGPGCGAAGRRGVLLRVGTPGPVRRHHHLADPGRPGCHLRRAGVVRGVSPRWKHVHPEAGARVSLDGTGGHRRGIERTYRK